jgi:hypothetical protein
MRSLIVVILIVSCTLQVRSQTEKQDPIPATSIFLEVFGNNVQYSINYDRIIGYHHKYLDGIRVGLSPYMNYFAVNGRTALTAGYYRLYGKNNKFFEAGLGLNSFFSFKPDSPFSLGFVLNVGYRKQGIENKPFFFRVAFTPMIVFEVTGNPQPNLDFAGPWGGVSLGYTFRNPKVERKIH